MFGLFPDTITLVLWCYNLLVRAATVSLTWSGLLGIGLGLNLVMNYVLLSLGASDGIRFVSSQIVLAFVLVLGLAAVVTSANDVIFLAVSAMRNSTANLRGTGQRDNQNGKE